MYSVVLNQRRKSGPSCKFVRNMYQTTFWDSSSLLERMVLMESSHQGSSRLIAPQVEDPVDRVGWQVVVPVQFRETTTARRVWMQGLAGYRG